MMQCRKRTFLLTRVSLCLLQERVLRRYRSVAHQHPRASTVRRHDRLDPPVRAAAAGPQWVVRSSAAVEAFLVFFRCQNWEGGLSGVPGLEAHGGYTFCGTAALVILGKEHMLDLKALLVSSLAWLWVSFYSGPSPFHDRVFLVRSHGSTLSWAAERLTCLHAPLMFKTLKPCDLQPGETAARRGALCFHPPVSGTEGVKG